MGEREHSELEWGESLIYYPGGIYAEINVFQYPFAQYVMK